MTRIGRSTPTGTQILASRPAATQPAASQSGSTRKADCIEYDFGKVWAGDPVKHTFEVANSGDQTLVISSVKATCGCTTTSNWEKQVSPGQVWKLEATLSTTGRKGRLQKAIVVRTGDPARSEVHLVLKGEIQPRFEISPSASVNFGPLQTNVSAKRTLAIDNKTDEPVGLVGAQPSTKFLRAQLREMEKGQRYELDVETVPPLPESGSLGTITVETYLKEQPKLTVPVYGVIRPRVSLSPKIISVPVPVVRDLQRVIQLMVLEGAQVRVVDVEASNPVIGVVPPAESDARTQRIEVSIPKNLDLQVDGETVTIYTDAPEYPKLTCQLRPFRFSKSNTSMPAASRPVTRVQRPPATAPATQAASSQPTESVEVR